MGTRAAFYVGDPRHGGELLGCIAYDGYPGGSWSEMIAPAQSETDYRKGVGAIASSCNHWTPASDGFPFPWLDDVFTTDCVYAWIDGAVYVTCFHSGFRPLSQAIDPDFEWPEADELDDTPVNVPAAQPGKGHDSIMIVSARR